jgi:hypothetical protein
MEDRSVRSSKKEKRAEQIEGMVQARGLIAAVAELDRSQRSDEELLIRVAKAAARRNALMSEEDIVAIRELSGLRFFGFQMLMCDIIPLLEAAPHEIMKLVRTLVEAGGEDLAANQPNVAFRKWCQSDLRRADDVIASARDGNTLARQHLVFALEAKRDVDEAFRSAGAADDEMTAGVLALSRIDLSKEEAERAVSLVLIAAQTSELAESCGLIKAALAIAGKHPGLERAGLANALCDLSARDDPIAVHLMAVALGQHCEEMTPGELESCLNGLLMVDASNNGTVKQIDWALSQAWKANPRRTGQTAAQIIARSKGSIGADDMEGFFAAAESGDEHNFTRTATEWLLMGDFDACSALTSHFSEINRTKPCVNVEPDDLPPSPEDQIFVCRKAVGFLFTTPMTAAAWTVAVLRGGHPDAVRRVAELLFDPLLLNYGGALKNWLEEIAQVHAPGSDTIRDALTRAKTVWDGFEAARDVVELEPPASHRALVQFQEAEEATHIQDLARERSVFAQLVTTQTLLYGDQSSFSIKDGQGIRRAQTVHMAQMSISSELPKGIFFDRVGLNHLLQTFRNERKNEP